MTRTHGSGMHTRRAAQVSRVCVKFVPGPGPVSPPCGTYYGTFTYTALGPSSTPGPFLLRVRLVCSGWVRARPACSRSSMRLRGRVTCMYVWMYVRCEMGGCCVRFLSPCQGLGPLCPASQSARDVHMCICICICIICTRPCAGVARACMRPSPVMPTKLCSLVSCTMLI